jgi:hypothetical protein
MRGQPFWLELENVAPTLRYEGILFGDALSGKPLSSERWASVSAPTLVIDGGVSEMMRTGADALASVLANARRCTLGGQTHDVAADVLAPAAVRDPRAGRDGRRQARCGWRAVLV